MGKKKFSTMSKEQKRMAVLRDALKLIRTEKVIINPQIVFQFERSVWAHEDLMAELKKDNQLQKILVQLLKKRKPCTVCQRGLLLVSTVLLDNKFKVGDIETGGCYDSGSTTDKRLLRIFSGSQLKLMEDVLIMTKDNIADDEKNNYYYDDFTDEEMYDKKFYFFLTFPDDTERSVAILENAISNKGIFKP